MPRVKGLTNNIKNLERQSLFVFYRYILEARKRALAKKKKLRTLGRRARSQGSDDEEEEVDGRAMNIQLNI